MRWRWAQTERSPAAATADGKCCCWWQSAASWHGCSPWWRPDSGNWAHIETSLAPDSTVLLFTLGLLILAALVFGLAPLRITLAAGAGLAMKTSGATTNVDAGKSRTGKAIVTVQMAFAWCCWSVADC